MIDLTILMDTKLGRPADMLEAAAGQGVEVLAGCLFPRLEGRVVHLAVKPEDTETVHRIAAEHGATVADERECVVVPPDFPGGVAAMARAVADAGIMVNISYYGSRGEIILGTSDPDGARAALGLEP